MNDEYFGTICLCAVRYAIGRETYMPSLVQGFVRRHIADITSTDIRAMILEIEERKTILRHRPFALGDPKIDAPGWIEFGEWLTQQLQERYESYG